MNYERILHSEEDGIATITLNFPEKRNALRAPMVRELGEALHAAETDDSVHCVVLTGAGDNFCAGGDMGSGGAALTTEAAVGRMQAGTRVARQLLELRKPVVAAVDGAAFGAGFSFAIAADLVIATPRSRFSMAFMRMGLVPDAGALFTLPRLVGLQRARELIYTGREIDGTTAREWGLVLELVEAADLRARSLAIAGAMKNHSRVAFAQVKAALLASSSMDLTAMLNLETASQALAFGTAYAQEVGRRFAEKQPLLFRWPAA